MIQANFRARLPPEKQIVKISERLIRKQITLFGHLLRAPLQTLLKPVPCFRTGKELKLISDESADPGSNGTT
eukprot:2612077-Heterocapsa_arctica.AAC.1